MKIKRSGFTLMEVLIFSGLASMLLIAIGSMFYFASRSMIALGNYNDLNQRSRIALDVLSRDIRSTRSVKNFSTNFLTFEDYDHGTLTFSYSPITGQLTKDKDGLTEVLLTECDFLNFHVYKRNPSNGFSFYPTTVPAEIKLIDVSWKCSRTILGGKVNTESVQTAKIVMRN